METMLQDNENFVEKLKDATSILHKIAERGGFNLELFKGNITKEEYGEYLLHKLHIYRSLESALNEQTSNNEISKIIFPELQRESSLIEDLRTLLGDNFESAPQLSSVGSYIYRIQTLATEKPLLLIAHAYTNYLADLSGGMIIKKILLEQYGYEASELKTYAFDIPDIGKFKKEYHEILAKIIIENSMEAEFIEEVKLAYIFSIAALNELVYHG